MDDLQAIMESLATYLYNILSFEMCLQLVCLSGIITIVSVYFIQRKAIKRDRKSSDARYESTDEEEFVEKDPVNPNVVFYRNQIPSKPDDHYIDDILSTWFGDYFMLESNHKYIQWLFPNRKPGLNRKAYTLNDEEARVISSTPELRDKVRRAFEMMLDFYGMRLKEDNQFELAENSVERLRELNKRYNHNFLRITRILLALKELGHKELMLPWMKFLAYLIHEEKSLDKARTSFENYWTDTLDAEDQEHLHYYDK